jgi:hypothetical protein
MMFCYSDSFLQKPTKNPNSAYGVCDSAKNLAGLLARMVRKRNGYRILVGKPEGERPIRRWVYNIEMGLRDLGWGVWTELIWFRTETSGQLL